MSVTNVTFHFRTTWATRVMAGVIWFWAAAIAPWMIHVSLPLSRRVHNGLMWVARATVRKVQA